MRAPTSARTTLPFWLFRPLSGWGDDLTARPAGAPAGTVQPFDVGLLSNTLLALLLVLALIAGMLWALRRLGQSRVAGGGVLRVVAGLPLGMRERVVLVQAGEARLLLGITPGRIETLYVLPGPGNPGTGGGEAVSDFRGQLATAVESAAVR